jgi:hypothetical protein
MWSIITAALGLVSKFLVGLVSDRQKRSDQIELGQQRQRTKSLEDDAAARQRVAQAEAKPRGDEETEKDLGRGTF